MRVSDQEEKRVAVTFPFLIRFPVSRGTSGAAGDVLASLEVDEFCDGDFAASPAPFECQEMFVQIGVECLAIYFQEGCSNDEAYGLPWMGRRILNPRFGRPSMAHWSLLRGGSRRGGGTSLHGSNR